MRKIIEQARSVPTKSKNYYNILALIWLCLLTACGEEQPLLGASSPSVPTVTTNTSILIALPQNSPLDWLKGVPCRPPCWEGIIPGQTSAKQAVEMLKKNSRVSNPQIQFYNAVTWVNTTAKHLNLAEAHFDPNDPKQIIYWIRPSLPSSEDEYPLKDILKAYGEPTYIIALRTGPPLFNKIVYTVTFIYVNYGMAVEGSFYKKSGFNQNLMLKSPELFVPTETSFRKIFNGINQLAVKWEGFKDFSFYCINGSVPCEEPTKP